MAKCVTFGMYWEMYSQQTLPIPDDIDENDIFVPPYTVAIETKVIGCK